MDIGFPEITDSFLRGQDILYTQFNDVEFFVEDIEQENFYYEILKKLFPNVQFNKIFPLGGKKNILTDANLNISNCKKVYIVDLDFDEILGGKSELCNVFYLKKYSIENYLLDYNSIREIIKEQKPKLKDLEIDMNFNFTSSLEECKNLYSDLICYYLIIQKYKLGIENVKNDTARFFDFNANPASIKTRQFASYCLQIETKLRSVNPRINLSNQVKFFKRFFSSLFNALKNIPGKYLLNFLKYRIERLFSLTQMTLESFTFRLAKNCDLTELEYLVTDIGIYINNRRL